MLDGMDCGSGWQPDLPPFAQRRDVRVGQRFKSDAEIAGRSSSTTDQIEDYAGITTDGHRNGAATDGAVLDQCLFSLRSIDLKRKNFSAMRTDGIGLRD